MIALSKGHKRMSRDGHKYACKQVYYHHVIVYQTSFLERWEVKKGRENTECSVFTRFQ